MSVLISGILLFFSVSYTILVLNPWLFSRIFSDDFIHSVINGHLLRANLVGLAIAGSAFVIALYALFTVRQNSLMVGGKKTLFMIVLISFICMVLLGIKSFQIVKPLMSGLLSSEKENITADLLRR